METAHVTVHRRARIAVDLLSDAERKAVFQTLETLSTVPPEQWPQPEPQRLKAKPPLYALRVTPDLDVFFSITEPGQLLIEDFVRPETLERYYKPHVKSPEAV
jgi:hypothetical protein